jgi:hypothetical protein
MSADHETTLRRGKTAATWAKKAAGSFAYMIENAQSDGQRNALGYFASRLLDAILDEAETLAGVVPSEYTEEALRSAEAVVKRLKQRRLAVKLADTTGRTPQEAEAFAAKAVELA